MHEPFCADISRDTHEQPFGTVKQTATWLLVEYNGRWEPDAFAASTIPDAVKARLLALDDADPTLRITVIRQRPRFAPPGITFYMARVREHDSVLLRFQLAAYEDLLALDIPAIAAGDVVPKAQQVTEPLFLVCTHGRRDKCCARYGVPVYEQMAARSGGAVWQTSHVGGHRFAANVLCLPDGILYGRVEADHAADLVDTYRAGQLPMLDKLRGRSAYPKHVQAAEALLRLETGLTVRDGLRLVAAGTDVDAPIQFESCNDGTLHTLRLAVPEQQRVLANCGDIALRAFPQYVLAQHTVEAAVSGSTG